MTKVMANTDRTMLVRDKVLLDVPSIPFNMVKDFLVKFLSSNSFKEIQNGGNHRDILSQVDDALDVEISKVPVPESVREFFSIPKIRNNFIKYLLKQRNKFTALELKSASQTALHLFQNNKKEINPWLSKFGFGKIMQRPAAKKALNGKLKKAGNGFFNETRAGLKAIKKAGLAMPKTAEAVFARPRGRLKIPRRMMK